jgi:DNA-binding transcriptional LysR family regulator
MQLPDLESLRCFEAVASLRSFRAAAATVALSPAAFSGRIKRLEEQLGVALLSRTTRRVSLTPAGDRLLLRTRRILEEAQRCVAEARDPTGRVAHELFVGTRWELGMSWLVPALRPLEARYPERKVHLQFGDSPDLLARIRQGALDCAVTSFRLTGSEFRYAVLHEEDYAFVGAASQLARHPLSRPEQAVAHALCDITPDLPLFRYLLDAWPKHDVWPFRSLEYLGAIAPIRARVLSGAGVAVLPLYFVREDLRRKRLVRLLPKLPLQRDFFRLVWRPGHPREAELRALAGDLRRLPLR